MRKTILGLFLLAVSFSAAANINNQIIAIAGTNAITDYELNSKLAMVAFLNKQDPSILSKNQELRVQALNSLIEENLLIEKSTKANMAVSEEEFGHELNIILNSVKINQDEITKAVKSGAFDKNTMFNYVKYQVLLDKWIKIKIHDNLQYSNIEKIIFREKVIKSIKDQNTEYKIFIINKEKIDAENLNFLTCAKLDEFIKSKNLTVISTNSILKNEISKDLFEKIQQKKAGLTEYKDNLVGFCLGQNDHKPKIMSDQEFEKVFEGEMLRKAIIKYLEELKNNNFILIKN